MSKTLTNKEWLAEKNFHLARLGVHWVGNTLVKIGETESNCAHCGQKLTNVDEENNNE